MIAYEELDWTPELARQHERVQDSLAKQPLPMVEMSWRVAALARRIVKLREQYRQMPSHREHLLIEAESLANERYWLMRAERWRLEL